MSNLVIQPRETSALPQHELSENYINVVGQLRELEDILTKVERRHEQDMEKERMLANDAKKEADKMKIHVEKERMLANAAKKKVDEMKLDVENERMLAEIAKHKMDEMKILLDQNTEKMQQMKSDSRKRMLQFKELMLQCRTHINNSNTVDEEEKVDESKEDGKSQAEFDLVITEVKEVKDMLEEKEEKLSTLERENLQYRQWFEEIEKLEAPKGILSCFGIGSKRKKAPVEKCKSAEDSTNII